MSSKESTGTTQTESSYDQAEHIEMLEKLVGDLVNACIHARSFTRTVFREFEDVNVAATRDSKYGLHADATEDIWNMAQLTEGELVKALDAHDKSGI